MDKNLRLLVVEEQPDEAELIVTELRRAGWEIEWERVQTAESFREALAHPPDVILADHTLPGFTGVEALDILRQSDLDLPFIVVTDADHEENAVEYLHRGADDYVLKDHLIRLPAAVQRALHRHEERAEKRHAEERAQYLHRVLRAIGDINQIIVRQRDRVQLLQQACATLLHIRNYHTVWAGLIGEDGQTVQPIAQAGTEADLSALAFRLDDPASGPHCGRTALTRRQPILVGQVTDSPPCTDCLYRIQADHLSALALPLAYGEQLFGLLVVFSAFPQAFNEEEIQLLTELNNDLSFALRAIEDEEERKRAEAEVTRRSEELAALYGIALDITSKLDLQRVLRTIVERATDLLEGYGGGMYLYRPEHDDLEFVLSHKLEPDFTGAVLKRGEGLSGKVLESRQPMTVDDYRTWPERASIYEGAPFGAVLATPIKWGERVLGVINVLREPGSTFDDNDVRLLSLLSNQAAVAIENARLYAEVQRRLKEQTALREAGTIISSTLDLATVLTRIAEQIGRSIDATSTYISDFDPETKITTVLAEYLGPEACAKERVSDLGTSYVEEEAEFVEALQAGQPQVYHLDDPDLSELDRSHLQQYGGRSVLTVPLRVGGQLIGFAELWESRRRREFTAEEIAMCQGIAQQAAIAIENSRLFDETCRRLAREEWLNELAHTLGGEMELATLIPRLLPPVAELTGADAATVAILDPKRQIITHPYSLNLPDMVAHEEMPAGTGLAGFVMETRRPELADDYGEHPAALQSWTEAGVRSVLAVPLIAGDEAVGALGLFSLGGIRPFGPEAVAAAEAAGRLAAVAIQRARLFEAEKQQRRQAETLRQVANALNTSLDRERVLGLILDQLARVVDYDSASVMLVSDDVLNTVAHRGFRSESQQFTPLQVGVLPHVQQVLEGRHPIIIPDTTADSRWQPLPGSEYIRCWLGVPLMTQDRVIGLLNLDREETGFYTTEHGQLAMAFAAQAATAIENARLFEAERRRVAALTALHETGLDLSAQLDLPTLLQTIVERAARLLEAPMGGLYLMQPDNQELELVVSHNLPRDFTGTRLRMGEGVSGVIAQTGRPLVVGDYHTWPGRAAVYEKMPFRAIVGVPIMWQGQVLGVINITDERPNRFGPADVEIVNLFADQAAVAIANARLFKKVALAEREWETTFDAMADAVSLHNTEYRIVRANQAMADLVGQPIQKIVGRHCYEIIHGTTEPIETCPHHETMSTAQPATIECELTNHNKRVFDVTTTPIIDAEGHVTHTVHVMHNVTERLKMQAQLIQSEKLAALGELVAGVAHELNNPLTAVVGYAQLLQRTSLDVETQSQLDMICHEAQRMARIVRNLLTFARQHEAARQLCNMNDIVQHVLELRAYELRTSNIKVVTDLDPTLPHTMADPHQLQQVFFNLIGNARQAMETVDRRGTLTVRTLTVRGGEAVQVMVQDDGPGILPEVKDKVFDPFFTTKEVGQGTGLGLSVCYGIVSDHNGRIWVESEPGQGATFIVELPVTKGDASWAREALAQLEKPLAPGSGRILVVEDEPAIARLLVDLLEPAGHRVVVVGDGQMALRALSEGDFDLIVSDIKMPGLGGQRLYARLWAERPELVERLVFATGDTLSPETQAFLREAGCRYLTKPFDLDTVERLVKEMLAKRQIGNSQDGNQLSGTR